MFAFSKPQQSWREVVSIATLNGIPVPAFSASLGYYHSYRAERLPASLLQALRELIRSLQPRAHPSRAFAFRKRPFGAPPPLKASVPTRIRVWTSPKANSPHRVAGGDWLT